EGAALDDDVLGGDVSRLGGGLLQHHLVACGHIAGDLSVGYEFLRGDLGVDLGGGTDDEQSFRYDLAIEGTLYHERALEGDRAADMEVIGQDSGDAGFIDAWHRLVHICCHFL